MIGLSTKVRFFSDLDIKISNQEGLIDYEITFDEINLSKGLDKSISSTWVIKPNQISDKISLSIKAKKDKNEFTSLEGVKLFRSLLVDLDMANQTF